MTAAFAVIAVVLSHFVGVMTLTFLALSSVVLTLPMMGGSFRGAVLAYVAAAGLSFLFVGYISVMPFVIVFGPYPLLDYLLRKYLKKRLFVLPLEIVFANGAFVACYFAIGLTLADFPLVDSLSLPPQETSPVSHRFPKYPLISGNDQKMGLVQNQDQIPSGE